MQDGRKSFRQIAREINVSTPTVESRFRTLKESGIIRNIEPVFDMEKIEQKMSALVYLKVNPSRLSDIVNSLYSISDVKSLHTITGDYDMIVKIIGEGVEDLEYILREKISSIEGITSVSFQILTRTIKDDHRIPLREGMLVRRRCLYCYNEIQKFSKIVKGDHPEKNFCCNSCLTLYKQKYRGSLDIIPK